MDNITKSLKSYYLDHVENCITSALSNRKHNLEYYFGKVFFFLKERITITQNEFLNNHADKNISWIRKGFFCPECSHHLLFNELDEVCQSCGLRVNDVSSKFFCKFFHLNKDFYFYVPYIYSFLFDRCKKCGNMITFICCPKCGIEIHINLPYNSKGLKNSISNEI